MMKVMTVLMKSLAIPLVIGCGLWTFFLLDWAIVDVKQAVHEGINGYEKEMPKGYGEKIVIEKRRRSEIQLQFNILSFVPLCMVIVLPLIILLARSRCVLLSACLVSVLLELIVLLVVGYSTAFWALFLVPPVLILSGISVVVWFKVGRVKRLDFVG